MGVFLKNKPSTINSVVSEGILQFLLMGILFIWLVLPSLLVPPAVLGTTVVEMTPAADASVSTKIKGLMTDSEFVSVPSISVIPKTEALVIMSNVIDEDLIGRVSAENPFRDVVQFNFLGQAPLDARKDFISSLEMVEGVDGVYNLGLEEIKGTSMLNRLSTRFAIPLSILCILLFASYIISMVRSIVIGNEEQIRSLSIYGSTDAFIKGEVQKVTRNVTIKGWIVAVFLFIMLFYLILGILDSSFSDIRWGLLAIIIFIPLLLTFIIKFIIIEKQLSSFLKKI